MLSIVIPAYNVEQYIEECLNSIIYQIELFFSRNYNY
ncbi:glycosyltransferase [Pseudoalteromonas marina]